MAPTWDRGRGPAQRWLRAEEKPQEALPGTGQKHLLASLATTDIAADGLQDWGKIKSQPTHAGAGTRLARGWHRAGRTDVTARRLCTGVQGGAAKCVRRLPAGAAAHLGSPAGTEGILGEAASCPAWPEPVCVQTRPPWKGLGIPH